MIDPILPPGGPEHDFTAVRCECNWCVWGRVSERLKHLKAGREWETQEMLRRMRMTWALKGVDTDLSQG